MAIEFSWVGAPPSRDVLALLENDLRALAAESSFVATEERAPALAAESAVEV